MPHNLISITTQTPPTLMKAEQRAALYQRMRDELLAVPGVESVDAVSRLPLSGSTLGSAVLVEGRTPSEGEGHSVEFRRSTPGYFATMRIPLRAGRVFDDHDGPTKPVAVISETMQRSLWPGESAIGRRIKLGPDPAQTSMDHGDWGSGRRTPLRARRRSARYGLCPVRAESLVFADPGDPHAAPQTGCSPFSWRKYAPSTQPSRHMIFTRWTR